MRKTIGLVAHDNRKEDLIQWVQYNAEKISKHKLVLKALEERGFSTEMEILKSGPLGGDQELGAKITEEQIDILIFLWDPMSIQPHDVDVKALLRLSVLYNIPTASNRSTADYIISSKLFKDNTYEPIRKDYSKYINRNL
jgi:methylglyoxal synthase